MERGAAGVRLGQARANQRAANPAANFDGKRARLRDDEGRTGKWQQTRA